MIVFLIFLEGMTTEKQRVVSTSCDPGGSPEVFPLLPCDDTQCEKECQRRRGSAPSTAIKNPGCVATGTCSCCNEIY